MVMLQLSRVDVSPGQSSNLRTFLAELGGYRSSRVAYTQGTLEIMTPLSEPEVTQGLVEDIVKILPEEKVTSD
ncbi:hypothetical protein IQ230_16350 [Gloeocapsopsis crepidinum LEGE 06123]|uniref:CpcD n=1 Tax=Gloeocapsopsis crepidinum LEGE 06123 TaxID=588587 RepID=A0ABR9UUB2_9CHRO|nr:hypothetical protein [Gloeocapsopsis crepidinum]MBE9191892.1 hypothetical protein [Gloeocapsopsis crepidinum LEGE 06123]